MYSLFNGKGNVIGSGVSLSHITAKETKEPIPVRTFYHLMMLLILIVIKSGCVVSLFPYSSGKT